MQLKPADRLVAIACGGTGGHLFPGIAIGEKLIERGCDVTLLVSQKEVDQVGASTSSGMGVLSLPAVPLLKGNFPIFLKATWQSFRQVRTAFKGRRPAAVLAMGSFTSAGPIFAGKLAGAKTALHESNSIPGRANRLLAPWVDHVFIGFSSAASQLRNRSVQFTGTPVRPQFQPLEAASSRMAMGLDPKSPVVLIMGGSQGATAVNKAVLGAVPFLVQKIPGIQFLHLTGAATHESIAAAYKPLTQRAKVLPFLTEMDLALGAASVCVSRAGASSLAEIAAMEVPSILIPYPTASDDHQYHNARAFAQAGAARLMVQSQLRADQLAQSISEVVSDPFVAERMRAELRKWHYPDAADQIAAALLRGPEAETQPETHTGVLKFRHG
jgi:UDP-N-acetylglucosamine--N-acetylmuramyl-(pentapeptide) pyrophosphoryl-undecaprenol N-acetylglucosamine transferase